jgi:hypothetical protein
MKIVEARQCPQHFASFVITEAYGTTPLFISFCGLPGRPSTDARRPPSSWAWFFFGVFLVVHYQVAVNASQSLCDEVMVTGINDDICGRHFFSSCTWISALFSIAH